jgi:HEAT repeat protein
MRLPRVFILAVVFLSAHVAWGINAQDLIKSLNQETGQKQTEAAIRLADFKYPEVVAALADKLADPKTDVTVRATCATSLGRLGDPSTLPLLRSLAAKEDERTVVRTSCIMSIAVLKGSDAIPELVQMLKVEKNPMVRSAVEAVLARLPDKTRVALAVSPLLQDDTAAPSAIRILGAIGDPAVIPPLSKLLDSPKASVRQAAVRALGDLKNPNAVPPLLAFYPKGNEAEKVQILAALANHPHPAAVKLMTDELENPKTYAPLRQRAALSLGALAAPSAVTTLVRIMRDPAEQEGLRLTCVHALGNFSDRDDDAIVGLIDALSDKSLADAAAISLSRVTRVYLGTSSEKWTEWYQRWLKERGRDTRLGH